MDIDTKVTASMLRRFEDAIKLGWDITYEIISQKEMGNNYDYQVYVKPPKKVADALHLGEIETEGGHIGTVETFTDFIELANQKVLELSTDYMNTANNLRDEVASAVIINASDCC